MGRGGPAPGPHAHYWCKTQVFFLNLDVPWQVRQGSNQALSEPQFSQLTQEGVSFTSCFPTSPLPQPASWVGGVSGPNSNNF